MKKEYLLTASQMKQYDENTSNITGIPSIVLMERAAKCVAEHVLEYFTLSSKKSRKILVVCGNGNNGADGVATGRILTEYGLDVDIYIVPSGRTYSEMLDKQLNIASHIQKIHILERLPEASYDVVIDAIFGIGLNREVTGVVKDIIDHINKMDAYIISVDIPSGLNASTGDVCGSCIKANETVTFGFFKRAHAYLKSTNYCGKTSIGKIGINETSFYGNNPNEFTYYDNKLDTLDKIDLYRDPNGNKGTFGKVLVIAGNKDIGGACVLAATSALKSGCGMVQVATSAQNKSVLLDKLPEAMFFDTDKIKENDSFKTICNWADVIAIGPGIGLDDLAKRLCEIVLESDKILVIDADAITLIANHADLQKRLINRTKKDRNARIIFTPHIKELSVLSGKDISICKSNAKEVAIEVAKHYHSIVVAKDAQTYVVDPDAEEHYINTSGCDALATAGSGDVLCGLIASMCATYIRKEQLPLNESIHFKNFYSVCMAVYLHGLAGAIAAKKASNSYVTASDIIVQYKDLFK